MRLYRFDCFSISPGYLTTPSLAIATVKAGGIGVLDLEFGNLAQSSVQQQVSRHIDQLLQVADYRAQTQHSAVVGLRLTAQQIEASQFLLKQLEARSHWVILSQWQPEKLPDILTQLSESTTRRILLEVTDIFAVNQLAEQSLPFTGWVVKGSESGGWVGEDTTFLLLQKVLQATTRPIYVRGGIGVHSAAACRAMGIAGVGLDDQLWLMPESPLPIIWKECLQELGGQEAAVIGEQLGAAVRLFVSPRFPSAQRIRALAKRCELESVSPQVWRQHITDHIGWQDPSQMAWPIGQGVGLAKEFADRYRTTGRLIQAILRASEEQPTIALHHSPLAAHSPLSQSHRTQYPIVQGPMTRVSDVADFAVAVAQAGALPMLALALLRGTQVELLLRETQELMAGRTWGVGILGFVPADLREEQLQVVHAIKPPFALIAGGRPDQADQLEQEGIATYLHAPTAALLQRFISQGARRFVFEGHECGGHVGPLSSFILWEKAIDTLLQTVPAAERKNIHVLFAGGIHDARSAAMISVMAAPLIEQGMKIGVLMGSAYLFTQEAVTCGAIIEEYQRQMLTCDRTITLETGPGHASRCAVTPFTEEFYTTRRKLLREQVDANLIKDTLEQLTLGRLRIASKGLVRHDTEMIQSDADQQLRDGMYMVGQAATLKQRTCTLAELHAEVSSGSTALLRAQANLAEAQQREGLIDLPESVVPHPALAASNIAIIGLATLLPKAQTPDEYWENILANVNAIIEIPVHRWDWRLYYDCDRTASDKIYSKWGGFLDDVPFDPIHFGIPPKSLKSIEPMQLLALEAVRQALLDAGYENGDFDREQTSVILGLSGGMADLGQQYATRAELTQRVFQADVDTFNRLPEWTEESFPGLLFNVTAGRIANRFDLGGSNFTVDAACASSLAAVDLAVAELQSGRCNVAITGGVDTLQTPFAYACFSETQALSPQGIARTFDQNANGIVISEGIAILVLKRLADAERDGDTIYAVIKSVASSSDGKGLSLTAPATSGQQRAFLRAYQKAQLSPAQLGLYEAHGTGTTAGDQAELTTITTILSQHQARPKSCAIGSVKTQIGHTKSTAGAAALVKAALALHHRVLPPHSNVEIPLEPLQSDLSPVYLLKEPHPWLQHKSAPRMAGVSAFGFGGTNFHAVLAEYAEQTKVRSRGAQNWPCELLVWQAKSESDLQQQLKSLLEKLTAGVIPKLRDLAYTLASQILAQADPAFSVRLSLVINSIPHLIERLQLVIQQLQQPETLLSLDAQAEIHLVREPQPADQRSQIAFLFPGQASQYPGMAREIALYFDAMADVIEATDQQLASFLPQRLSQYIYPPSAYSAEVATAAKARLTNTHVAQPAIGTIAAGYLALITQLGLQPDMVAGHSYGEYAALYAAGVLSQADFLRISEIRGRVMSAACHSSDGAMAIIKATREEILQYIKALNTREIVVLANHNAPLQSVISGQRKAVETLVAQLQAAQITARLLPVAGAFHSHLVESAQADLAAEIADVEMEKPVIPVYSNVTASPYAASTTVIRQQLAQHLLSSVKFVDQINAMYEAGARIFVEVGPKSVLTNLVNQILAGRENYVAIALDDPNRGLKGFLHALGGLFTCGVALRLDELYIQRNCKSIRWHQLQQSIAAQSKPTTCYVNGGSVRFQHESVGYTSKLPPLTLETKASSVPFDMSLPNLSINTPGSIDIPSPDSTFSSNHDSPDKLTEFTNSGSTTSNFSTASVSSNLKVSTSSLNNQDTTMTLANSHQPQNGSHSPIAASQNGHDSQPTPTVSSEAAILAYQDYQETMREFLRVQEQVIQQFLSSGLRRQPPQQPSHPQAYSGAPAPSAAPMFPGFSPSPAAVQPPTDTLLPGLPNQPIHSCPAPVTPTPASIHPSTDTPSVPPPNTSIASAVAPVSLPASVAVPTTEPDREGLAQLLLNLVSDSTGYPVEILGLEQDIEAELGIDSIKRVEIFGTLVDQLPKSWAAALQPQMDNLVISKTFHQLVDAVLQIVQQPHSALIKADVQEDVARGKSIAR